MIEGSAVEADAFARSASKPTAALRRESPGTISLGLTIGIAPMAAAKPVEPERRGHGLAQSVAISPHEPHIADMHDLQRPEASPQKRQRRSDVVRTPACGWMLCGCRTWLSQP